MGSSQTQFPQPFLDRTLATLKNSVSSLKLGANATPARPAPLDGQEVLQSLEAIKGQTPSRQGGVTQGAARPSPADRPAGLAWCSAPLRFRPIFRDAGILPLNRSPGSPQLLLLFLFLPFFFSCFPPASVPPLSSTVLSTFAPLKSLSSRSSGFVTGDQESPPPPPRVSRELRRAEVSASALPLVRLRVVPWFTRGHQALPAKQ